MSVDPAFQGAGQSAGVEIWRIEKFKPVAVKKEDHGKFFSGDSYIVLHTKKRDSALEWDLHFWLGEETSQDEMGTCAYKTVELDDYLGGAPVQYREVQGGESQRFLSIFKGGVEYKKGGVDSGFKKVEKDVYETRLLQLKGKRTVRMTQVPLKADSLNDGDVFILDAGLKIYQWNGKEASKQEKAKGLDVATQLRNQRGARPEFFLVNDGAGVDDFWKHLGGKPASIKSAAQGGDDAAHDKNATCTLYKVSDAGGSLQVTKVGETPLDKAMLDSNDCFILDAVDEIFVWVGKGATAQERKESMVNAGKFLTDQNRPKTTPITRVAETGETPAFKEKFKSWPAPPKEQRSNVAKVTQKTIDFKSLSKSGPGPESDAHMFKGDPGTTPTLKIWRIENFKAVEVSEKTYGQFFAGDSYVLLYTYIVNKKPNYVVYFWLGADSSQDERGAAALIAKEKDDELGGEPVQVRVTMGKEPEHFLRHFKGKMIIHAGGCASGFKNLNDKDTYDTDGVSLFHVRGTNDLNTRAVQVPEKAGSLNSGDVFVLLTPNTMFVWYGKGSNEGEKACGNNIAAVLQGNRALKKINEGDEPSAFWDALGGKGSYSSAGFEYGEPREPRLFQLSNATGQLAVEEIYNFSQDDLDPADIFMLDLYTEIYLWIGDGANEAEKKGALEGAIKYVAEAQDGRDAESPITNVIAGHEPPMFTAHFLGWDPVRAASKEDPAAAKLRALRGGLGGDARSAAKLFSDDRVLSYEELKKKGDELPVGIDPLQKEKYLSDAEFQKIFKMSKAEFAKLPKWKADTAKKGVGLF